MRSPRVFDVAEVSPDLLTAALDALAVDEIATIGAPGGQKAVRHVRRKGQDLVLKVIALDASLPAALQRATREVDLLAEIENEHVVKVASGLVELGEPVEGAAWLEEFLDGQDLSALVSGSQLWGWDDAAQMALQVARGLAAGHGRGVVHRDLSPNNVRRVSDGTYKVIDFGVARFTLRSGLTVAGQPGTPGFMTPEHLNAYSGAPMPASDVFAVGALIYLVLAGEPPIPWRGDEIDYATRLRGATVAIDIADRRPDLTDEQAEIVRRCLHPQPARRFATANKLAAALEKLA